MGTTCLCYFVYFVLLAVLVVLFWLIRRNWWFFWFVIWFTVWFCFANYWILCLCCLILYFGCARWFGVGMRREFGDFAEIWWFRGGFCFIVCCMLMFVLLCALVGFYVWFRLFGLICGGLCCWMVWFVASGAFVLVGELLFCFWYFWIVFMFVICGFRLHGYDCCLLFNCFKLFVFLWVLVLKLVAVLCWFWGVVVTYWWFVVI